MTAGSVTLNPGAAGEDVATDEIAGVVYQRVKLVDGAIDGTDAIGGDATNGLDVDVTRVGGTVTVDGSGVTQPVSGTVTANLSATDNAVLDSIAAAQLPDGHNVTIDNAFVAVTGGGAELGALRVTLANDSTGVLSVDDGGGSLTVDGTVTETNSAAILADTAAMDTNLATIAGAVSGTEMQVDIVSGGTGSTQYAEDSVHTTGDIGTMMLGVRQDTQADFGADGDYVPASIDANGAIRVNAINADGTSNVDTAAGATDAGAVMLAVRDDALTTLTPVDGDYTHLRVNSTGALHVTGAGGGTQYSIDDAAPTVVTMAGAIRDDTLTTLTEVDGDATALRVSSTGALHVTGGGGGTEYTVDVAAPAAPTGTASLMERDDALSTLTEVAGDWIQQRCNANGAMWTAIDGNVTEVNSAAILADTANMDTNLGTIAGAVTGTEMQVDVVTSALPTGAATAANQLPDGHNVTIDNASGAAAVNIQDGGNSITVDGTVTANLGATDNAVLDDIAAHTSDPMTVAHDAAATGAANVNMAGARATNSIEGVTQVANGDATRLQADLNGVLLSRPHTTPEEHISERVSNTNGTSTAFTNFAAGGAGIHNYVTDITVYNSSATDGYVDIRDGAAGAILWTLPLPATGGATHSFSLPLKGAANTALAFDVSAALTTVYISVNGFQAQG